MSSGGSLASMVMHIDKRLYCLDIIPSLLQDLLDTLSGNDLLNLLQNLVTVPLATFSVFLCLK